MAEKRATAPTFDPRSLGARCDECALGCFHREQGTWNPVPAERHGGEHAMVLAEFPEAAELKYRTPLVGFGGQLVTKALISHGIQRQHVVLDHAVMCGVPGNDLKLYEKRVERENKARERRGLPRLLDPITACRPHVYAQAAETPNVLALGAAAYRGLTSDRKKIRKIRGSLADRWVYQQGGKLNMWRHREGMAEAMPGNAIRLRIVPTVPAYYANKYPAWRIPLATDVGRWKRWVQDDLDWRKPQWRLVTHPEQLQTFLDAFNYHGVDIETDGRSPYSSNLRTIQIADPTGDYVLIVPFRNLDGSRTFLAEQAMVWDSDMEQLVPGWTMPYFSPEHGNAILEILRTWLLNPHKYKSGHNFGYFDIAKLWRVLGVSDTLGVPGLFDTILGMRACFSELPRDLYTTGTMFTDVPDWKAADDDRKIALNPRSFEELCDYGATDASVSARVGPIILKRATERKQLRALEVDHHIQTHARQMNRIGMFVDEPARQELEAELTAKVTAHRKAIADHVGDSTFNPGSNQQLGKLFFDDWGLPILRRTDSEEPSTDDTTLFQLIQSRVLTEPQREFVDLLRLLRKVEKELGTYVLPLRPWDDLRPNSEGRLVGGLTGQNGRVNPSYNVHTPGTGRISSSEPNAQNFPKHLRRLIIPEPGRLFCVADYDQIELRLICAIAQVKSYLDVFAANGDPHGMTALLVYGKLFEAELKKSYTPEDWEYFKRTGVTRKATKGSPLYESLRRFAKTFVYAVLYGGTAKTVFENVSTAEENGKLLFEDMTLGDVSVAYNAWMKNAKEIPDWWHKTLQQGEIFGWVEEPVLGRRRDVYERNEMLNHPIQGGAAAIMAEGMIRLVDRLPFDSLGSNTGMINACHDAVTVEVPEKDAAWVQDMITESLTTRYDHLPNVEFSAAADIVINWKETPWKKAA